MMNRLASSLLSATSRFLLPRKSYIIIPHTIKIRHLLFHGTTLAFKQEEDSLDEKNQTTTTVRIGFDGNRNKYGRKQFNVPGVLNVSTDNGETSTATSIIPLEILAGTTALRPYAEIILEHRMAKRSHGFIQKRKHKESVAIHHKARIEILNGTRTLSYRNIQKLVRLNNLGKATGKKEELETRLLSFYRRVDPKRLFQMNHREVMHITRDIDWDISKNDSPITPGFETTKKLAKQTFNSVVADLDLLETDEEIIKAQDAMDSVFGAFFASAAPTGRVTCHCCRDKITKGSMRVSEHVLTKWFKGNTGSWSPRQTIHHYHAYCFMKMHCDSKVNLPSKELTVSQLDQNSAIRTRLRDVIITKNIAMEKNKEYRQIRQGQIRLTYPGSRYTFGFEFDPRSIETTIERKAGVIHTTSKIPAESDILGNDEKG